MVQLGICAACLGLEGTNDICALADAVAQSQMSDRVVVKHRNCRARCARPARLWLQSKGGAAYVFEGIDLAADQGDILATLTAYLNHPGGWIEDARPCGRLRFCLTARVPA